MKGYIILKMVFKLKENVKTIKFMYLIVEASSSYKIIIGRSDFNLLKVIMSKLCLRMKCPLKDGCVDLIERDQDTAQKFYQDSLRIRRAAMEVRVELNSKIHGVNFVDLDPGKSLKEKTYADRRLEGGPY